MEILIEYLTDAISLDQLPKTDAIFLFGCSDIRVARQGLQIFFFKGHCPIIISGKGHLNKLPNPFKTEAEYFARYLQDNNADSIKWTIIEKNATNTLENVLYGIEAAQKKGITPCSLTLVSKPPLLRRARATFLKHFPDIRTYGSAYPFGIADWQSNKYKFSGGKILGEIERLQIYAKKGDIAPVNIPLTVMSAYHTAKRLLQESD